MKKLDVLEMEQIEGGKLKWRCWLGIGVLAIGVATGIGIVFEAVVVGAAAVAGAEVAGGTLLIDKHC
jgi:hypothetical protein